MNMYKIIKHLVEIKTFSKTWEAFQDAQKNEVEVQTESLEQEMLSAEENLERQAKKAAQKKRGEERKKSMEAQCTAIKEKHDKILKSLSATQQALFSALVKDAFSNEAKILSIQSCLAETESFEPLLSLARLAHAFEHNGSPEQHVSKLIEMCGNFSDAFLYVSEFSLANPENEQCFHDACLFELPDAKAEWDVAVWRKHANNNQKWGNLIHNKDFRGALACADKIEKHFKAGITDGKNMKQVLKKCTLADLVEANLKLSFVGAERNLKAARIFKQDGLTQKDFDTYLSLTPQDSEAIPSVCIEGKDIFVDTVYYLKKMDSCDPQAASLGKKTACCQSLGSNGEACAIYGITSPNSGFYVVYKKRKKEQCEDDAIVAQAWAWLSKTGAIVLDSIEFLPQNASGKFGETTFTNLDVWLGLYKESARRLVTRYGIPKVMIGSGRMTPEKVGFSGIGVFGNEGFENPIDYVGYRDSHNQTVISVRQFPLSEWLFLHEGKKLGGEAAKHAAMRRIQEYFNAIPVTECLSKLPYLQDWMFKAEYVKDWINDRGYIFPSTQQNVAWSEFPLFECLFLLNGKNFGREVTENAATKRMQAYLNGIPSTMCLSNLPYMRDWIISFVQQENTYFDHHKRNCIINAGDQEDLLDHFHRLDRFIASVPEHRQKEFTDLLNCQVEMYNLCAQYVKKIDVGRLMQLISKNGYLDFLVPDRTLLLKAVGEGDLELVKLLLIQPKIDMNIRECYALLMAAELGHWEIVKLILMHPNVCVDNKMINELFQKAVIIGHWEIVEILLEKPYVRSRYTIGQEGCYDTSGTRYTIYSDKRNDVGEDVTLNCYCYNNIKIMQVLQYAEVVLVIGADPRDLEILQSLKIQADIHLNERPFKQTRENSWTCSYTRIIIRKDRTENLKKLEYLLVVPTVNQDIFRFIFKTALERKNWETLKICVAGLSSRIEWQGNFDIICDALVSAVVCNERALQNINLVDIGDTARRILLERAQDLGRKDTVEFLEKQPPAVMAIPVASTAFPITLMYDVLTGQVSEDELAIETQDENRRRSYCTLL